MHNARGMHLCRLNTRLRRVKNIRGVPRWPTIPGRRRVTFKDACLQLVASTNMQILQRIFLHLLKVKLFTDVLTIINTKNNRSTTIKARTKYRVEQLTLHTNLALSFFK